MNRIVTMFQKAPGFIADTLTAIGPPWLQWLAGAGTVLLLAVTARLASPICRAGLRHICHTMHLCVILAHHGTHRAILWHDRTHILLGVPLLPIFLPIRFAHWVSGCLGPHRCHKCFLRIMHACDTYTGPFRRVKTLFYIIRWALFRPFLSVPWPSLTRRNRNRDLEREAEAMRAHSAQLTDDNGKLRRENMELVRDRDAIRSHYRALELAFAEAQSALEEERAHLSTKAMREAIVAMRDTLGDVVDDYVQLTARLVGGAADIEGFLERMQSIDASLAVLGPDKNQQRVLSITIPTRPKAFLGPKLSSMQYRQARDFFSAYHPDKVQHLGVQWLSDLYTVIFAQASAAIQSLQTPSTDSWDSPDE